MLREATSASSDDARLDHGHDHESVPNDARLGAELEGAPPEVRLAAVRRSRRIPEPSIMPAAWASLPLDVRDRIGAMALTRTDAGTSIRANPPTGLPRSDRTKLASDQRALQWAQPAQGRTFRPLLHSAQGGATRPFLALMVLLAASLKGRPVALGTVSEFRRPVPLALAIATVALLTVDIIMAVQQSDERRSHARHITMLMTVQEDLRQQLAQQQATAGTLTELQARTSASVQEGKLATQKLMTAREELAALELRRSELQQRTEEADKMVAAQAQQLVVLQTQAQQSNDALAAAARDIALAHAERGQIQDAVSKLSAEKLSSASELEATRSKLAETQGQLSSVADDLTAKTGELATLDKLLSVTRRQVAAQKEPTGGSANQNREIDPEANPGAPAAK